MSMLYRTPLAPIVIGGTLDLLGGWGLQIVMALLFAASVVAWTRTALAFGAARRPRDRGSAARVSGLRDSLPHAGERAGRRCRVRRMGARGLACVARAQLWTVRRVGAATAAAALARPGFQAARARRGAAARPSPALAHAARVRRRLRRSRTRRSWGRGRSRTGSATTITPSPAARGVLPVLPRVHDRSHRPSG